MFIKTQKTLFLLIAVIGATFFSCQKDDLNDVTAKDVQSEVNLETSLNSKAIPNSDRTEKVFYFKGENGKYLSSENGIKAASITRTKAGEWEKMVLVPIEEAGNGINNLFAIRASNNKYLTVDLITNKLIFQGTLELAIAFDQKQRYPVFNLEGVKLAKEEGFTLDALSDNNVTKFYLETERQATDLTEIEPGSGSVSPVTIFSLSNQKYVSSENGKKPASATRNGIGAWEKYEMIRLENGAFAFKGNNGKFLTVGQDGYLRFDTENTIGVNSIFQVDSIINDDGTVDNAIWNEGNGRYVSSENGKGYGMTCIRTKVNGWEKFIVQ